MNVWQVIEIVLGFGALVCILAASLGVVRDALEDNRLEELRRK